MADSYGPAQERRTRTNVQFKELPRGESGRYDPSDSTAKILANIRRDPVAAQGTITIDPSQSNDVGRIIRHEAIHQLFSRLPEAQARQIASSPSNFNQIADILRASGRQGNPADEAPSYMGAYEPQRVGPNPSLPFAGASETQATPFQAADYRNQIIQNLMSFPDIQRMYGQLTQQSSQQPQQAQLQPSQPLPNQ